MRERKWERGHDIEKEAVVGGVVGEDVTLRRGVLIRHTESAQVRLREVEDRRRVRLYHQLPEAQPTSYLVKHLRSKNNVNQHIIFEPTLLKPCLSCFNLNRPAPDLGKILDKPNFMDFIVNLQ